MTQCHVFCHFSGTSNVKFMSCDQNEYLRSVLSDTMPCLYHVLVETISGLKPEIVSTKTWYKHGILTYKLETRVVL